MERQFWISMWRKEGAKPECPFCGQDRWIGWDKRIPMSQLVRGGIGAESVEITPLTCSICGFVRLLSDELVKTEVE